MWPGVESAKRQTPPKSPLVDPLYSTAHWPSALPPNLIRSPPTHAAITTHHHHSVFGRPAFAGPQASRVVPPDQPTNSDIITTNSTSSKAVHFLTTSPGDHQPYEMHAAANVGSYRTAASMASRASTLAPPTIVINHDPPTPSTPIRAGGGGGMGVGSSCSSSLRLPHRRVQDGRVDDALNKRSLPEPKCRCAAAVDALYRHRKPSPSINSVPTTSGATSNRYNTKSTTFAGNKCCSSCGHTTQTATNRTYAVLLDVSL